MSTLHAEIACFEATSRQRVQAEREAGRCWSDSVLRRLTDRRLRPLDEEERRFIAALNTFDREITRALHDMDIY